MKFQMFLENLILKKIDSSEKVSEKRFVDAISDGIKESMIKF